jgi:hypothetical protein
MVAVASGSVAASVLVTAGLPATLIFAVGKELS